MLKTMLIILVGGTIGSFVGHHLVGYVLRRRERRLTFDQKVDRISNNPVFQEHMTDLKAIMAKHGITSEEDDAKHRTT